MMNFPNLLIDFVRLPRYARHRRNRKRNMHILYLSRKPREEIYQEVLARMLPSDQLYGIVELQQHGYDVNFKSIYPQGFFSNIANFLYNKYEIILSDLSTLLTLRKYDVIVVHSTFSTLVTLACKLFNKKVVYLDALFSPPKNIARKILYKLNLTLSDGIIVYSQSQLELWSNLFNISTNRFKVIPYTIDISFYEISDTYKTNAQPFVLSVGRDQARDYETLVKAMEGLGVNLKIVTLPYLEKY